VGFFILFFLFIGGAIDYLYFDAFTRVGPAFPVATIFSLGMATLMTLTAYYGGSGIILSSVGAEKPDLQIPEHRELRNIVTEMALASGSAMPPALRDLRSGAQCLRHGHQREKFDNLRDDRPANPVR